MKPSDQIQLTDADKARYEKRITEIDLNNIPMVVKSIPVKIERLIADPGLLDYQIALVTLKKRILFALEYFLEEQDEIPDNDPQIGLLDDYVLVRWVVDNIMADYTVLYES